MIAADDGDDAFACHFCCLISVLLLPTDVVVKPLVKHHLSVELQLYYEKITEALLSNSSQLSDVRPLLDAPTLSHSRLPMFCLLLPSLACIVHHPHVSMCVLSCLKCSAEHVRVWAALF